ncbi:MAG: amidohydrolase family protein [Ferruginibacter sp.]|nr:amidohydrolase family protein [Cytophagales bacterium]
MIKNKNWKIICSATLILLSCVSYGQQTTYNLAIKNVKVFDSKTKKVQENKTILINSGTIVSIVSSPQKVKATKTIDGNNRLVVPGFIDTHTHLRNVYGIIEDVEKDSVGLDRKKLSDTYLKYGTTTIVDMGQPEKWMNTSIDFDNYKNFLSGKNHHKRGGNI